MSPPPSPLAGQDRSPAPHRRVLVVAPGPEWAPSLGASTDGGLACSQVDSIPLLLAAIAAGAPDLLIVEAGVDGTLTPMAEAALQAARERSLPVVLFGDSPHCQFISRHLLHRGLPWLRRPQREAASLALFARLLALHGR